MAEIKIPKKLIEVALPLDIINKAAAREKSIRHGHPSTLHLWWARRPLAAARAVIFAQMVNDPGYERHLGRGVNKEKAQKERERLFGIIERLVQWENTNNETVLNEARDEIWKSWRETCDLNKDHPQAKEIFNPDRLPAFHDPFAGGGALPLEAQRLGMESYASDLNPVAVLINKAMIEIPSKFSDLPPIGRLPASEKQSPLVADQNGAAGLAEDVRRYGWLLRSEAFKRIGNFYPKVEITEQMVQDQPRLADLRGEKLTVIAWLWARTVKSPSPAFSHIDVPLISSFVLSAKKNKDAYIEPIVSGQNYRFAARAGISPDIQRTKLGTTAGKRNGFVCLMSGAPIDYPYIRSEGVAGRMGTKLLAVVAEGQKGRVYLSPNENIEAVARLAKPEWRPEIDFFQQALGFRIGNYGKRKWSDLFTPRQTLALDTLSSLIMKVHEIVRSDALKAKMTDDGVPLDLGGTGATAYADAICTYLAFQVDQLANHLSEMCAWHVNNEQLKNTFARQALSMTWDFAETNPFSSSTGSLSNLQDRQVKGILSLAPYSPNGKSIKADAATQSLSDMKVISTDPPYYNNIGYADLSDFFYVWTKRSLEKIYPQVLASKEVPKVEELVATPDRHGGLSKAESFFLSGMTKAMCRISDLAHPVIPVTIYYAFKQSETKSDKGTSSTGWETFLEAVFEAGFSLTGTWPMRTEQTAAMKSTRNALASSIVLVCRKRQKNAPTISRREFIRELNAHLPDALEEMTTGRDHSPVAPVDLSQAIIGPGMAIFSKYTAVLEADGKAMSVRTALQLINRFFAEDEFDHDTQFCLQWFQGYGWDKGAYGEADVLARAKGTSVEGLKQGGIIESASGVLRLLRPKELQEGWLPENDTRISVWEILHHMIKAFNKDGEDGAGAILSKTQRYSEAIRTLAYRLYTTCERKGWANDAGLYNSLIVAWENIESSAQTIGYSGTQIALFNEESEKQEQEPKRKTKTRKKS